MTHFLTSRRQLILAMSGAMLLAPLDLAVAAEEPSISVDELMATQPLPDLPLGDRNAPITIIEYASLTCSHCAEFARATFPVLKKDYIDTGKVLYILREYAFDALATAAFMLARCAGDDKRNAMVELFYQKQSQWVVPEKAVEALQNFVKQAGMSQQDFEKCLSDTTLADKINRGRDIATQKFAVTATPTFFINGRRHTGFFSVDDIPQIVKP